MQKNTAFSRNKTPKRPGSCPSLGRDSCSSVSQYKVQVNACTTSVKGDAIHIFEKPGEHGCKSSNVKHYRTRFFYNSSVKPKVIEASLARKSSDSTTHVKNVVKTRCPYIGFSPKRRQNQICSDINVFSVVKNGAQRNLSTLVHSVASSSNGSNNVRDKQISGVEQTHVEVKQGIVLGRGLNPIMAQHSAHNDPSGRGLSPKHCTKHIVNHQVASESDLGYRVSVNTTCADDPQLKD